MLFLIREFRRHALVEIDAEAGLLRQKRVPALVPKMAAVEEIETEAATESETETAADVVALRVLFSRERRELVVTMAPGAETCWSGLFIETRDWNATGLNVGQRVMVKLYGINPPASTDGSIASVAAESASGPPPARTFRM